MLDDSLPVTLQYQLRNNLMKKIGEKVWASGSRIPSERELCESYGVSRMTVREVLKDLVQEGYLVRKQGKGTFVAVPKFEHELSSSYSLSQEIEKEGLHSEFRLLAFTSCSGSPALRELFGLSDADRIYEITRLRLIGDEMFAWEKASVPSTILEGATEQQLKEKGLYLTIFQCSGLMADEAEVESEALNCPDEIAEWLQIKRNAAVLHLTRTTKAKDRLIEYCESYIRSDKYKYKYIHTLRKKAIYDGGYSDYKKL